MERRGGLGRGLGALIPTSTSTSEDLERLTSSPPGAADGLAGAVYREIPPRAIVPNPRQPRSSFDEDALAELVASIAEVGVLQPVVVRQTAAETYELVMGERRWRAAQQAGLTLIPAIVRATADDAMLRDALLENLHRQQLNPLEEAAAYQQLLQEFGATHEELGARIGRSRPQISNTIRLLQLTAPVQRRVAAGVLSAGHARALLGLHEFAAQEALANRIVAEGLSVRSVEELVAHSEPERRRPTRAARTGDPRAEAVADRLAERFQTGVKVVMGRSRGTLTIGFADLDDLHRIVDAM